MIAKYLKNLCENEIISPTAEGKAGVHLFLVGKNSPGNNGENEGNEGWKALRKEYEDRFQIKIEENNKKNRKTNGNYLIDNEGYEAFKEEEGGDASMDEWEYENPDGDSGVEDPSPNQEQKSPGLEKVHNDFDKREETINYLDKESKRELNQDEIGKLGKPESQFEKLQIRKQYGAINMCTAVALSYRYQAKGKRQTLLTNIQEARNNLIQAIAEAERISDKEWPLVFAKVQWSKKQRLEYLDYLQYLKDYYARVLTVKNWENLYRESPFRNHNEKEYYLHFQQELPYYISLQNKQPLFIVYYDRNEIVSIKKYCMKDRKIEYQSEDVRIPIFIACSLNKEDYCGLRSTKGDYLYYIKQYMEKEGKRELNKEEFGMVTDLFFNMDVRLTKVPQTKSEDDKRKMNLESSIREGAKDLAKDFSRTDQKTQYRPVTNCLLMNLSVQKNVTVLPEPRKNIQKLAGMKIFSCLDFSNFFFQISADENYSKDVCLVTELGCFSPAVALQGDTNSPGSSTFISNSLLYKVEKGISLIDDLLFANNTVEKHLEDFERILSNIAYVSEARRPCKLRTDKIKLLSHKVEYCGNILEDGKVKITSHKLKDYLENEPTTYGQLTSVICLANWFAPALKVGCEVFKEIRDEIKPFSSSTTIKWTESLRDNYNQVVSLLRQVPPMFIPEWDEEELTFTIHVDSSQMAIGGLLGQQVKLKEGEQKPSKVPMSGKGIPGSLQKKDRIETVIKPITYFSRVLQANERNLPIMHLELRAMYEACVKFREFTRMGCKLKLYSDNSGVYYLLKKMLDDPNLKLDDTMAKLVALLHGTQAEIHFIRTEMNPADYITRVIPTDAVKKQGSEGCYHIREKKKFTEPEERELEEYLMKGKASEKHKRRMELPEVDLEGKTKYRNKQEDYEKFPLDILFERLKEDKRIELPKRGMIINKRNVENIIESAIVNNIKTDQLGVSLEEGKEETELEELRIKQRDNPYLNKLIRKLEESKGKTIMKGRTEFKLKEGCLVGNAAPNSSTQFKLVVPEEDVIRLTFLRHKMRHFGKNKLYQHLKRIYLWNVDTGSKTGIKETVEMVVKSCLECSVYQRPTKSLYKETFKTLHAAKQYNCGAVVFLDHYSIGKTASRYKEMVGALCGRCKRAMVEPVERGNSNHTAHFILRQVCNPIIPSRLISDHGSAISMGMVPKLLEAINAGIANFYDLKGYKVGSEEQKVMEELEDAMMLMKWKEAHKHEFEDNQQMKEKLYDLKQRIAEGRIRLERAERERMAAHQWQKVHKNKDVRRIEHMKSSVYRPTSHSSIERFFLTFSTLIRKLFEDENDKWTDYVDQVVALYNNTPHMALRGHSPNSAHFNLMHDQTQPMIHQLLNESMSKNPFVVEERILFNRSLRIFNEAGIEKYFEPRDRKEAEERKHEKETQPQVGDLVWVRRLKRLNKHPKEGYLMGPCLIVDKPSSQQVEVLYLLNGNTAKRHYTHVTQFYRPIGTDTEKLLEYSSAPKLYQDYEGRRISKEERNKLIHELEEGLQGKTYLSSIDDLEEVDMLLKDRFSLINYPEKYSEERTERLREIYDSNTPEGRALRDSVMDKEELEEVEEFYDEDDDKVDILEEEEDEEEEEFGKTVRFKTSEVDTDNIIEGKRNRREPERLHYTNFIKKKEEEKLMFERIKEVKEESIENEIDFLIEIARRNAKLAKTFQNEMEIDEKEKKRSPKRVRFSTKK